jgi:hypothetical protein
MKSVFMDKEHQPTDADLRSALENTYTMWKAIAGFTREVYPEATELWSYAGSKSGWHLRLKDKKKVIVYLLPRDKFFKTSFVFGHKATEQIVESNIAESIKETLKAARVYAEGRGVVVEVREDSVLNDVEQLISIKISN